MMFNLITVYGQVLNTYWFKYAYNALQQKQAHAFWALAVTYERVPEFPYFIPGFLGIGAILTVSRTLCNISSADAADRLVALVD